MNCRDARRILDERGPAESSGAALPAGVRAHLEQCAACLHWTEESRQLEALVVEHAIQYEPSPFLWTRLEARLQENSTPASMGIGFWLRLGRLQWAAGLLTALVAILGSVLVYDRSLDQWRGVMLGQIDAQWEEMRLSSDTENPFPLIDAGVAGENQENPYPVFMDTKTERNPFESIMKS